MTDEKYLFVSDVREKKNVARSARSKRTHTGKRGGVKLPSDYMTEKEKRAMNGECKSYKLNEPMTWNEFKAMPEDIRVAYINALRTAYNVSDSKIAEMMGIGQNMVSKEVRLLGIGVGRGVGKRKGFKKEEWLAWCNGASTKEQPAEKPEETTAQTAEMEEEVAQPVMMPLNIGIKDKSNIERALGILEGISYCVGDGVADGILTAIEQIEAALKGGVKDGK